MEPGFAAEILHWLTVETSRRTLHGKTLPHLCLFVDDLDWLTNCGVDRCREMLSSLLEIGPRTGVHLVLSGSAHGSVRGLFAQPRPTLIQAEGLASAEPEAGSFAFAQGSERRRAQVAWLPARDLNSAARLIEAIWLGSGGRQ